jgi:hypothetical protein
MSDATPKCAKAHGHRPPPGQRAWIALAPALALLGTTLACLACGDAGPVTDEERAASASEAIYAGTLDSDGSQNQAVVALKIGDSTQQFLLCSGALIAPNVVLTARHCVAAALTTNVACDQNGQSGNGSQLGADTAVGTIHVFTGAKPNLLGTPDANAKAIFHSQSDVICNQDVAVLVLDRSILGIAPVKVRLNKPIASGEMVRAVGYGQNDQQLPVGTRLRKDAVGVLAVGSTVSASQTALATNEFELGLSICQGDSGGPAISESTGAVLGVVSRGGQCTDTFGHIYTSIAAFKSVLDQAMSAAGGQYYEESSTTNPPPATGSSSGGTSSGGSGGQTTTSGNGAAPHPASLRAGAGNNCDASGATPERSIPASVATGGLLAFAVLAARRRRGARGARGTRE